MSAGPASGHVGFVHEVVVYDSDDELLDVVVPHLEAGVAAREPTYTSLPDREAGLVRRALGDPTAVTFLPSLVHKRPPAAIKQQASLLGDLLAGGVEQVRVVNAVPHPGLGAPWDGWCRYEAAINGLYRDLPVWGLCLYDRRITPAHVLHDVERTHPRLATAGGGDEPNPRYQDPEAFLRSMPPPAPDPLEAGTPAVELADPAPAVARHALRHVARRTRVAADEIDELVVATSEAVTNALAHGRPPVTLKAWAGAERMVVTVSDRGEGPDDPYAGLVARPSALDGRGGYGLWIMHQLVAVAHGRTDDGFTVRLVAGEALP